MPPTPRWLDFLIAVANAPVVQRMTVAVVSAFLRSLSRDSRSSWVGKMPNFLGDPSDCCAEDEHQALLAGRFLELLDRSRARAALAAYCATEEPGRLGKRLEALARVVLLGCFRHRVLNCRRGSHGVPATVLFDAQLAPYPACPLDCTGCWSREDRSGRAPDRAQLAWLVDQVASCGAMAVNVVGKGEPLLTPEQAEDLLAVAGARPHLLFTIATSGITLTDALARRLAGTANLMLLVSVEGTRAVHDARRGTGMYDRARSALEMLKRHGVLFGYACMVARTNFREVTDPDFVRELAGAGCVLGVYSRYFPLSAQAWEDLALGAEATAEYLRRLDRARPQATMPLADLDDLEERSGCRARAGASVYIDGTTGSVSPCARVPFTHPDCRLDRERDIGLAEVLAHPFLADYRAHAGRGRGGCGADLAGELDQVAQELEGHGARCGSLAVYRDRAARCASVECQAGCGG